VRGGRFLPGSVVDRGRAAARHGSATFLANAGVPTRVDFSLRQSLEANAPLTDAQGAELDYRMARYKESPADAIPWEQVRVGLGMRIFAPSPAGASWRR
jgi:putative addiction module component (TIGR02574 family)